MLTFSFRKLTFLPLRMPKYGKAAKWVAKFDKVKVKMAQRLHSKRLSNKDILRCLRTQNTQNKCVSPCLVFGQEKLTLESASGLANKDTATIATTSKHSKNTQLHAFSPRAEQKQAWCTSTNSILFSHKTESRQRHNFKLFESQGQSTCKHTPRTSPPPAANLID